MEISLQENPLFARALSFDRVPARSVAIHVKRKAVSSIRHGHTRLFEDSIARISNPDAPAGSVAVLFDPDRNFLAAGLYDPASLVRVKIFSHDSRLPPVGPELYAFSAQKAAERRAGKIPPGTDAWRLVNGDSDGFPGMVADKYSNALVCKFYSAGLLPHAGALISAVARSVPGIDSLVVRFSRELQSLPEPDLNGWQDGAVLSPVSAWDGRMQFHENGILFEADLKRGQKTGFFLDQRENRMKCSALTAGCSVLNLFSYSGGFSLYAAKGGAKRVLSVDADPHAVSLCERNFHLNPALDLIPHEGISGDVFEVLADFRRLKRRFDLVIADPPSFAKSEQEKPRALRSYARLAKAAAGVLKPGGTLVFASCSSRVPAEDFFRTVSAAVSETERKLKIFDRTFHAPDHPCDFPENCYLKCLYAKI